MSALAQERRSAALKRLWNAIPDGAWLSEREVDDLLIRASGAYSGDYAIAGGLRASLVAAQVVTVRRVDGTRDLEYQKAPWREWPDNGPGSEAWNQHLREAHEHDMSLLDAEREREFASSPLAVQRRQILDLVDQRVDERLGELLRALDDDAVARLRERHMTDDAGDSPAERS